MNTKDIERFDLSRSQWELLIDEWIFKEAYRAIIKDRLLNGLTYEELAEKHYMSVPHIKNIVYKCMDKLIKHI